MISTEVLCNLSGIGKFAEVVLLEAYRERFDWLRHHLTHQPYHHARIDSPAQKCSQRHLAHQTDLHCVFEQCTCALNGCRFIVLACWSKREIPVAFRADVPIFVDQDMSRGYLQDALEECIRCGDIAIHTVFVEVNVIY